MEKQELEKWLPVPTEAIIEYIEDQFHTRLRANLPEILKLFEHVANHHGKENPKLIMAHEVFESFSQQMTMHLLREEQIIFPMLLSLKKKTYGDASSILSIPIQAMENEHQDDFVCINKIKVLMDNLIPPENACRSYRSLVTALQILFDELEVHIFIENEVLFKRFKRRGEG